VQLHFFFNQTNFNLCYRTYRKELIVAIPTLQNLDDAPCFPRDRRLAKAFMMGGFPGERAEREAIKAEEAAARERNRNAFNAMVERSRAEAKLKTSEGCSAIMPWMRGKGCQPAKGMGQLH
jgi:hypothetical protein